MSTDTGLQPRRAGGDVGESSFAALCVALCATSGDVDLGADFPLRERLRLRSNLSHSFPSAEYAVERSRRGDLPTLRLSFLTLAGPDGALPSWLSERLLWQRGGQEGAALHEFLDLLNRRFWELLVLSQSIGGNAHYAFLNTRASRAMAELSLSIAGLSSDAREPRRLFDDASFLALQRHCLPSGRGAGGGEAVARRLSLIADQAIQVEEHVPVRLDTVEPAGARLGHRGTRLGGTTVVGAVLGRKAWAACAMRITVTEPADLEANLPHGERWKRLRHALSMLYAKNPPPLQLELRVGADRRDGRLGSHRSRLGWGARVGGQRPSSQIIKVSRRALDSNPHWEDLQ